MGAWDDARSRSRGGATRSGKVGFSRPGPPEAGSLAVSSYLMDATLGGSLKVTDKLTSSSLGIAWPTGIMMVGPGMLFSYALVTKDVDPLVQVYGLAVNEVTRAFPTRTRVIAQLRASFAPNTKGSAHEPRK